ncbi:MAG: biotin--[acetyl-CoA-carboxylase] ligase [Butyricicoccus pullicaecorum]|nr:biotin--[acetyl-CoA-carboxylase] ligase [Butyricicoccus pullicaecorum]MDO4668871.1 biotin--[acetyl-CoA-carboxylase] ligase [Butyricicoccus pullicaecorum]
MNDILSSEQLLSFLQTKRLGHSLKILSCTDSTNTQIKHNYKDAPEGFVLLAEQQTAGRGRLDRKFLSPKGDGIYFSLVLRPNRPMRDLSLLTPLAAVAVCEALQTVCGITSSIKWVNDVFLRGKKICGILTETCGLSSDGCPALCIVGIGLNLRFDPATYPELSEIAGSIADAVETLPTRAQLTAAILNAFEPWYDALIRGESEQLLQAYRDRLLCLGKKITVQTGEVCYPAICTDLTADGNLVVQDQQGDIHILQAGEIRIRPANA